MDSTSPEVQPEVIDTVAPVATAVSSTSESDRDGVIASEDPLDAHTGDPEAVPDTAEVE